MFLKPITLFLTVHRVFYCAPLTQGSAIAHVRAFLNAQAGHVFEAIIFMESVTRSGHKAAPFVRLNRKSVINGASYVYNVFH